MSYRLYANEEYPNSTSFYLHTCQTDKLPLKYDARHHATDSLHKLWNVEGNMNFIYVEVNSIKPAIKFLTTYDLWIWAKEVRQCKILVKICDQILVYALRKWTTIISKRRNVWACPFLCNLSFCSPLLSLRPATKSYGAYMIFVYNSLLQTKGKSFVSSTFKKSKTYNFIRMLA